MNDEDGVPVVVGPTQHTPELERINEPFQLFRFRPNLSFEALIVLFLGEEAKRFDVLCLSFQLVPRFEPFIFGSNLFLDFPRLFGVVPEIRIQPLFAQLGNDLFTFFDVKDSLRACAHAPTIDLCRSILPYSSELLLNPQFFRTHRYNETTHKKCWQVVASQNELRFRLPARVPHNFGKRPIICLPGLPVKRLVFS